MERQLMKWWKDAKKSQSFLWTLSLLKIIKEN